MIEEKIFEILNLADGYQKMDNSSKKMSLEFMEKEWDNLPDEKYITSETSIIALMMINEYMYFKDFEKAKKWADILSKNRKGSNTGGNEMILGKIYFEEGNFETAKHYFNDAYEKSKGREFQDEDPKYLDFYRNPEKYMK
ncbi:hypothetical protein [Pedobacter mendelii]|uniref:Tetratricopeptide repeat protein n=1 Tax=Pedobacter mendelii TaxID=1908240 RepID=A0ABQ2BKL5_9SPHI|nr:hypothetical protein [Pedobacter mendelii]GGI28369.1 hypothetical protein GCM10008119_32310 [Pedobacter mendelii]